MNMQGVVREAPRTYTCGMEGRKTGLGRGKSWAVTVYQVPATTQNNTNLLSWSSGVQKPNVG